MKIFLKIFFFFSLFSSLARITRLTRKADTLRMKIFAFLRESRVQLFVGEPNASLSRSYLCREESERERQCETLNVFKARTKMMSKRKLTSQREKKRERSEYSWEHNTFFQLFCVQWNFPQQSFFMLFLHIYSHIAVYYSTFYLHFQLSVFILSTADLDTRGTLNVANPHKIHWEFFFTLKKIKLDNNRTFCMTCILINKLLLKLFNFLLKFIHKINKIPFCLLVVLLLKSFSSHQRNMSANLFLPTHLIGPSIFREYLTASSW